MQPPNGEVWMSLCPNGTYHRYLPGAGTYTITVKGQRQEVTRRIDIKKKHQILDIRLDKVEPGERCEEPPNTD